MDTPAVVTPRRVRAARLMLCACCLSQFVQNVYGSVVNIAVPDIASSLGATVSAMQWVVSAYILALASLLTFAGTLADRFGRRRILLIGNAIMIVGAVWCALSPSSTVMIAGRVVQGVGSALIAPAGLSILTAEARNGAERSASILWWTMVGTASLAAGPVLGGLLVRDLGWESVFWAGVPLGIVTIALTLAVVPESRAASPRPFDPVGQTLVTVVMAALAFTLIEGSELGWGSVPILAAAATAMSAVVVLIVFERRQDAPVIPPALFGDRPFVIALLTAVLGYAALAGLLFANTFYLRSSRGFDAMEAGLAMIPIAVGGVISSWVAAQLVERGRSNAALLSSGVLLAVSSVLLWATVDAASWLLAPLFFLFGIGFGLIADPVSVRALAELPRSDAGLASSLISTSKQAGQILGIAIVGTILVTGGVSSSSSGAAFDDVAGPVFGVLAACGVGIVVLNLAGRTSSAPRPTRASVGSL